MSKLGTKCSVNTPRVVRVVWIKVPSRQLRQCLLCHYKGGEVFYKKCNTFDLNPTINMLSLSCDLLGSFLTLTKFNTFKGRLNSNHDTTGKRKSIASMPPGHCLGALEMLHSTVEVYYFLMMPFTKEKMPWCPCPFKNKAYRPATV